MAYNLNINNTITSCYWFEWILAFETKCEAKQNVFVKEEIL